MAHVAVEQRRAELRRRRRLAPASRANTWRRPKSSKWLMRNVLTSSTTQPSQKTAAERPARRRHLSTARSPARRIGRHCQSSSASASARGEHVGAALDRAAGTMRVHQRLKPRRAITLCCTAKSAEQQQVDDDRLGERPGGAGVDRSSARRRCRRSRSHRGTSRGRTRRRASRKRARGRRPCRFLSCPRGAAMEASLGSSRRRRISRSGGSCFVCCAAFGRRFRALRGHFGMFTTPRGPRSAVRHPRD